MEIRIRIRMHRKLCLSLYDYDECILYTTHSIESAQLYVLLCNRVEEHNDNVQHHMTHTWSSRKSICGHIMRYSVTSIRARRSKRCYEKFIITHFQHLCTRLIRWTDRERNKRQCGVASWRPNVQCTYLYGICLRFELA